MPFNGSGTASPPNPPTFPAVSGQTIEAAKFNATINDIYACLSQCVTRDGQSTISALTALALTVTGSADLPAGTTLGGLSPIFSRYTTGEVITTVSASAPAGTLALDGKTIGSGASGATGLAASTAQALFELLWDSSSNTLLPIQDASGAPATRGVSASADFTANKRLPLPAVQDGDALIFSATSGVMTRTVGEVLNHAHTASSSVDGYHNHNIRIGTSEGDSNTATNGGGQNSNLDTDAGGAHAHYITVNAFGGTKNKAAGLFFKAYIAL